MPEGFQTERTAHNLFQDLTPESGISLNIGDIDTWDSVRLEINGLSSLSVASKRSTTSSSSLSTVSKEELKATMLFKKISLKLDALSHFHFAPKPVIEDMSIQVNVPALTMEEVAPLAVSDAAMLAPEVIFHGKGNIKEEAELTKEERKRRRANQKRRFRRLKGMKHGDTTPRPRRGPGRPRKQPIESVEVEPEEHEADSVGDPAGVEVDSSRQTPQTSMRNPGVQTQAVSPRLPPVIPTPVATPWTPYNRSRRVAGCLLSCAISVTIAPARGTYRRLNCRFLDTLSLHPWRAQLHSQPYSPRLSPLVLECWNSKGASSHHKCVIKEVP
ncbi:hypothetical protein ZIOFF_071411 [Zingiber officinale]|uniref:Uncharacterized protein n=1 Tax=Zingiber officinale TaxID=94328 RepID=A0A8J5CBG1_ZINOF|nr:hypothetical protein ZIOFF_071411 [Zingiber officinale]